MCLVRKRRLRMSSLPLPSSTSHQNRKIEGQEKDEREERLQLQSWTISATMASIVTLGLDSEVGVPLQALVAPSATSISVDDGQVDFAALEQLENPDLHVDSVWIMNLFRKIKEVLPALECPKKFSLKDPIKPEADRTDSFLSASQFCIYRHEK